MKAFASSTAFHLLRHAAPHPVVHSAWHLLALAAALSLLAVSTAAWADVALGPNAVNKSTVELNARPTLQPWNDGTAWQMRVVRWAPAGSSSLGVSMGVGATQAPPAGPYALQPDPRGNALVPEVGVRWRSPWQANRRMDVGAYGSYDASAAALAQNERRSYNARVELQFREGRSKFGFDVPHGALGLQVGHDSQVMLRSRHGGPMVYYRSKW